MMKYRTEEYHIDIFEDPTFDKNSADNLNHYNMIYFEPDECVASIIGVKICQGQGTKSVVIASGGGRTGVHDKSVIIENDRLVICCSHSVFCLNLPTLDLLWRTQADTATCFEIFKYKESYIVHGELDISRLDRNGKLLWRKSGADIFTTINEKDDFIITDNYIIATDWNGKKYKFDFDGKIYPEND